MSVNFTTHDLVTLGMMAGGLITIAGTAAGLLDTQNALIMLGGTTTLGGYLLRESCRGCPMAVYARERGYNDAEKEVQ